MTSAARVIFLVSTNIVMWRSRKHPSVFGESATLRCAKRKPFDRACEWSVS